MIDYRDLLRKYIQHVSDCEGVNYIGSLNNHWMSDVVFNEEEVKALQELDSDG